MLENNLIKTSCPEDYIRVVEGDSVSDLQHNMIGEVLCRRNVTQVKRYIGQVSCC